MSTAQPEGPKFERSLEKENPQPSLSERQEGSLQRIEGMLAQNKGETLAEKRDEANAELTKVKEQKAEYEKKDPEGVKKYHESVKNYRTWNAINDRTQDAYAVYQKSFDAAAKKGIVPEHAKIGEMDPTDLKVFHAMGKHFGGERYDQSKLWFIMKEYYDISRNPKHQDQYENHFITRTTKGREQALKNFQNIATQHLEYHRLLEKEQTLQKSVDSYNSQLRRLSSKG